MKITTNSTEILEWDLNPLTLTAEIQTKNSEHIFVSLKAEELAKSGLILNINNEEDLWAIHKAMGDLISHLDRKRGVGNPALTYPAGVRGDLSPNDILTFTSGHDSIQ